LLAGLICLVLSFWLGLWISPILRGSVEQYRVGEYTTRAIRAPQDISIPDEETTNKRREEAALGVFPVYDYDPDVNVQIVKKIRNAFGEIRTLFKPPVVEGAEGEPTANEGVVPVVPREVMGDAEERFMETLGIELSDRELRALESENFSVAVEDAVIRLLNSVYSKPGLVWSLKSLEETLPEGDRPKGVILRGAKSGEEIKITNISAFLDMESAGKKIEEGADKFEFSSATKKVVVKIAKGLARPNLSYNLSETENRREKAVAAVQPVVFRFAKNQLIIGEGEPITDDVLKILTEIRRSQMGEQPWLTYLVISIGIYLILIIVYFSSRGVLGRFHPSLKDIGFLAATLAIVVFASWIWAAIADSLSERFDIFAGGAARALDYIMPVAASTMIVSMMMPVGAALVFSIFAAVFSGVVFGGSMALTLTFFIGSIFGITAAHRATTRGALIKTGLAVGVIQAVAAVLLGLIMGEYQELGGSEVALFGVGGFLGGILIGPICVALAPVVEFLFSYSTGIRLLELASLNHPLLKELVIHAPGTYHHSTMVASLAEGGAEAMGANALLAKVAALYHDVGKISMPHYFIENFRDQSNLHDRLLPQLSTKIIKAHVKEGVDLAKRYKLGQPVIDIIAQHHGTSIVRFFYERARELEDPLRMKVDEEGFRYSGPKPQTSEAAIVMMADVIEAATRTLRNPSYTRIKNAVRELIQGIMEDGQLDESGLTFRDISAISEAFTRLLVATFHQRIEYPGTDVDEGRDSEQAGTGEAAGEQPQEAGSEPDSDA